MSLQNLAFIIALALIAQAAIFGGIAIYRHRLSRIRGQGDFERADDRRPEVARPPPDAAPAWPGLREFRVKNRVLEDENGSTCSFYLEPVDGKPLAAFVPGQYLTFHLEVDDPATQQSKRIVRCYSLSDRPHPSHFRITVKRIDAPADAPEAQPGFSSTHFHRRVQVGDLLAAKAPAGHFQLQGTDADPIVLIGGGIGITPMLSMLAASLDATPQREIWLFYAVRNGAEHIMKTVLSDAAKSNPNLHLHVCYSRPRTADVAGVDYLHAGHVDLALLRQTLPLKPFSFYICGPRAMMESLVPGLAAWGIPEQRIHYEAFGPASLAREPVAAASGAEPPLVTFAKSGKSVRWNPGESSLLAFAESHGINPDFGCRAGGCGSCQMRINSGEVAYDHAPDFDPEPCSCLLCVSVPKGDLVLDV